MLLVIVVLRYGRFQLFLFVTTPDRRGGMDVFYSLSLSLAFIFFLFSLCLISFLGESSACVFAMKIILYPLPFICLCREIVFHQIGLKKPHFRAGRGRFLKFRMMSSS